MTSQSSGVFNKQMFPQLIVGASEIVRQTHAGKSLDSLWEHLIERVTHTPEDASAIMDLSTILMSRGQMADALRLQRMAIDLQRDYCIIHGDGSGLRILAFVAPGDLMANTPIDFLLNGSNCRLWLCHVDADTETLAGLPEHDVAFVAVGESEANGPILDALQILLSDYSGAILNNAPALIKSLTRDGVSLRFADTPSILAPFNQRRSRAELAARPSDVRFPVIVRPVGTHAGNGMHLVTDTDGIIKCLAEEGTDLFYVAPFIDYSGTDGLFAKQRIVLIQGKPYPSHMAISSHWMVHYMNADMQINADKRAREAAWMDTFDDDFAIRHAEAFRALYSELGLNYFGIDCAETQDGKLLLFELDVAMIVHDMDGDDIYAYKKPHMHHLFDAFIAMCKSHCLEPSARPQLTSAR